MALCYPLRIVGDTTFVHILDQSGRAIAGGLVREDAEEIVNALNSQPKRPALSSALLHKCSVDCDPDKRLLRDAKAYVERQRARLNKDQVK